MELLQTRLAAPDWIAAQTLSHWLTPREIAACDLSPSPRRRADRLAGRLAAKRLLLETLGVAPLSCEIGSDGCAPIVIGPAHPWNLSLSHSAGIGAAAWAETATEGTVGMDVQRVRPIHPGLRARALNEDEQAQDDTDTLLFWALKEAAIKARRRRWERALRDMTVTVHRGDAGSGTATIWDGAQTLTATWMRLGDVWLARAVIPPPESQAGLCATTA